VPDRSPGPFTCCKSARHKQDGKCSVTNIGSQPQTLDDSSQYVYDASDRRYDASTSADMDLNSAGGSDSVFFNDINPGNTVKGELAFDMPTGVKAVKAELHDSAFSGGVTVKLR
jgi:hypothetical protein